MKCYTQLTSLILAFLILSLNTFAQKTQKVLIIGIDGVRPDALAAANTPNMDALIAEGFYSPHAQNSDVTYSGPGWSAMVTGVWSNKHGVTNNAFTGSNYENYPHFFKYIEDYDPNLHTVSICHWSPINLFIANAHADFTSNPSSDAEVANQAANYLTANNPDVIFLHFDDVDGAGHGTGFSPNNPNYINTIELTDTHVGTVLQALYARPTYDDENWLILSSTDHGGIGTSHGGTTVEEETIFFLAKGEGIENELLLADSTVTVLPAPENCLDYNHELQMSNGTGLQTLADPIFNFGTSDDFSVEVRVRTTNPGDVAIIGNKDWDSGLNTGWVFSFEYPSGPNWKVNVGDGSQRVDIETGGQIADGQWHTLSATFDRDGDLTIYEDGNLVGATSMSFIGNVGTGSGIHIGRDIVGDYAYNGAVAEVRIWDGVLHPNDIGQWHCQNLTNAHPSYNNLISYWKLDDNTIFNNFTNQSNNTISLQNSGANWATITDITTVDYDFTNTPRITDVALSALDWMCIDAPEIANLDGNSWVSCNPIPTAFDVVLDEDYIKLYPNPTHDVFEIKGLLGNYYIKILDASGAVFQTLNTSNNIIQIDVTSLPPGLYFISMVNINNGDLSMQKILKGL